MQMMSPQSPEATTNLAQARGSRPGLFDSLVRNALFARLRELRNGCLVLVDRTERHRFGAPSAGLPEPIVIHVHDARLYGDVAFGGSVGAGEAYMRGYWSTNQLVDVVRLFVLNMDALDGLEGGFARLTSPLRKALHALRRNTRDGSRRNIAAHYDLGNEFFRLFLDETLMYSAARFEYAGQSLHDAQVARLDRICRKLELEPTDHLLEIGTGWGGLALHAAQHFGCRVTTTTISREQWRLARERVREAGLEDRIEVLYLSAGVLATFASEPRGRVARVSPGDLMNHRELDGNLGWILDWHGVVTAGETLHGPAPLQLGPHVTGEMFRAAVLAQLRELRETVRENTVAYVPVQQGYIVATACRSLFSLATGQQTSKERAVEWMAERRPDLADFLLTSYATYRADIRGSHERLIRFIDAANELSDQRET